MRGTILNTRWLSLKVLGLFALMAFSFSSSAAAETCPNEAFRTGLSAGLPDCRAYELVTPSDTNGRLIGTINTFRTPPMRAGLPIEHASPLRDSIVYFSYNSALQSPEGGTGITDIYEAERGDAGWVTTRRVSPPGSDAVMPVPGGVSRDHLYAGANVGGTISPMALGGDTDYLLNPDGSYELAGLGSLGNEPFAQTRWIGEGGEHMIFTTGQSVWCGATCKVQQLEPDAPPTGTAAIYDRSADGPTHVVSLLPGNVTPAAGEGASYQGVSRDASAVAFIIKGTLYVRLDNVETRKVVGGEPTFAGLSADGQFTFYISGGNIHRFDNETANDQQVNSSGDGQVVTVSVDGSHVYFISKSQLDGGKGIAGQPNMYVWTEGSTEYVATVAPSDLELTSGTLVGFPNLTNWTTRVVNPNGETGPATSSTRTTPDGTVLVFESRAQLTSYDNDGHTEIYRYDAADKVLSCLSCNQAVEPALADASLQNVMFTGMTTVIHNVSNDGRRVFFETSEALVGADDDGVNDIYEWQEEEGGGIAVDLISSGQSVDYPPPAGGGNLEFLPTPNILLSVTPDSKDVVFLSQDVLVQGAGEGGTAAIYDARVDGGFPIPATSEPCLEEGCRSPAIPPSLLPSLLQSESTIGSGNVKPRKRARRCRRTAKHSKRKHCTKHKVENGHLNGVSASSAFPAGHLAPQPRTESTPGINESTGNQSNFSPGPVLSAGSFDEFGFEAVGAEESTTAAGMHPDIIVEAFFNHFTNEKNGNPESSARTEEVSVFLPPGLLGNPTALPRCKMGQLVAFANCPIDSQIGIAGVTATLLGPDEVKVPIFNLEPPHPSQEIARVGFYAGVFPVYIDVDVRTATDYGATATVHGSPGLTGILGAKTTIWGNPADESHDVNRLTQLEAIKCGDGTACEQPEGKRPSGLPPTTFMTNPSTCQEMEIRVEAKSYQLPGKVFSESAPMEPIVECSGLPFAPTFDAQPTSRVAGAPTGLKTTLILPQESTEAVNSPSASTMREALVTLPEGMTIAAGAADGLEACSDAQVGYHEEVDAACPDASKLGTATITSPYLSQPLEGAVYQRTPRPGHLFGLWLVTDELGLHVKIPGEIEPNPSTGQLTAVFSNLPQVPVGEIDLNVWGGPRAPLKNPDDCDTYATSYTFTPHSSDPAVSGQSQMTIDQGCNTGGFSPKLHAGVTNPIAGAFSPFVLDLAREDGEQNLASLAVTLPDGELAKLAGVPLCPDDLAASGNCPVDSKIGSVTVATGPGPQPLWLPQSGKAPTAVYLAGPYKGAPFSVVTSVPAQAGPFDLGVVSVRSALEVDPETAKATVRTDPLPQFIEGVAAVYRRIHVVVDRPNFSLNPTDCRELAVTSAISSTKGAIANPSSRFQVDGCKALKYTPKLKLTFKGGTKRSDHPAVKAVLTQPPGQANTARATVLLPASEFIDQDHINNPCTRVQFREGKCPKLSILGRATAITPLLDQPLKGPVYFRSNGGDRELPDIVADLRGQIHVTLVGFVDAVQIKGTERSRIRTRFMNVPDAPVTKFTMSLLGGKKRGLLENSRNLCKTNRRARVILGAQNGRRNNHNLLIRTSCGRSR